MTTKQRKKSSAAPESEAPVKSTSEAMESFDPSLLTRKKPPVESLHLNLRLTDDNAQIYKYLEKQTPTITDSLRIRDCVRIAAFLCMRKQKEQTVLVEIDGKSEDLLEYLGAFYPQTPMDTRRRTARDQRDN